jgi:hypothetical protein
MRSCAVSPGIPYESTIFPVTLTVLCLHLAQRLDIVDEHAYVLCQVVQLRIVQLRIVQLRIVQLRIVQLRIVQLRIHDAVFDWLVQEPQVAIGLGRTRRPLRLGLPGLCGGGT